MDKETELELGKLLARIPKPDYYTKDGVQYTLVWSQLLFEDKGMMPSAYTPEEVERGRGETIMGFTSASTPKSSMPMSIRAEPSVGGMSLWSCSHHAGLHPCELVGRPHQFVVTCNECQLTYDLTGYIGEH